MKSLQYILALYQERKNRLDPLHQAALQVRNAYYGDITLAMRELDDSEKPMVANLLYQGGEQRSMRVASTMPDVRFPSKVPGQELADKRARQRRLTALSWWDDDRYKIKHRKRARHLVFYASCPVLLRPDMKEERPTWQVRNPLHTFAPDKDVAELCPPDCIFTTLKSEAWLQQTYPGPFALANKKPTGDGLYTVIEYVDGEEFVLAVIGEKHKVGSNWAPSTTTPDGEIVQLERVPNRTGECTAIVPGRIGLEHARGEFDGVVGLWQAQARMMALLTLGTEKAIFPEQWLVSHPNETAKVIREADPFHGVTGEIEGGSIVQQHVLPEAFATNIIDRIERALRLDAGVPAELGGESTSNIRTGRRGDSVLSAVMDFPIQEEQEMLAVSMREELRKAIAIDKAYFKASKTVIFSATAGEFDYEAEKLWESDKLWVRYARAGVDAQGLTVEIGQRVGMGTLSKESAMEIDPLVEDPQSEFARMMLEQARAGLQQSMAAMASDPSMAPVVAQQIIEMRGEGTEIEDAVLAIHQKIQAEQQAQQEQAAQAQAAQGAPPGAEAQPGMAQPIPTIPESPGGVQNVTALLSQLHRGFTAGTAAPQQLQQV